MLTFDFGRVKILRADSRRLLAGGSPMATQTFTTGNDNYTVSGAGTYDLGWVARFLEERKA